MLPSNSNCNTTRKGIVQKKNEQRGRKLINPPYFQTFEFEIAPVAQQWTLIESLRLVESRKSMFWYMPCSKLGLNLQT